MLIRKLFRTAWKYKAQFISMIIMVAIGVGVFVGFNMEWYSLERDTSDFFARTDLYRYRIIDEKGFTEDDVIRIRDMESSGVGAHRVLQVNADVADGKSLSLWCEEGQTVNGFLATEGSGYSDTTEGFWLSDQFARANGYELGSTLTVTYRGVEISAPVRGLGKSGEYLVCVSGDSQLMPDYSTFGFAFVSPVTVEKTLGFIPPYPMICFNTDLSADEVEDKVTAALGKTTLLLTTDEHTSYAAAQSEIEEGQTMGSMLPVLFLVIGILTMVTTMHRICANEKTQIGTLKALGFKNAKILRHYTSYGLVIGVVGSLIGLVLGFGIAAIVVSPGGMMSTYFDMPSWNLYIPWFCWLVIAATVAFLTLIGYLSVRRMLKGTAADALRPYTPRAMKPTAVEKTRAWAGMSFATKWNIRDIFRHKARSFMTLIGVVGCMILLVGGLGMRDTMTCFLDTINSRLYNYETRVNIADGADNEAVRAFAEEIGGDLLASTSVRFDGEPVALEIYDVTHDRIRFTDGSDQTIILDGEGVYVCIRIAERGVKPGQTIEISPYGSDRIYSVKVAGILRSFVTENITMTKAYADSIGLSYRYSAVFTDRAQADVPVSDMISGKQSKADIMDSYDSFMDIMNVMVAVLVIAAVVLGVVVLYNLGVMSYVERSRELATLKVVGFKNKRIGRILISQNIWLTVLGIVIGLPSGVGVLCLLLKMLATEYELKMVVGALTYAVSILLTFGVSLAVGFFVARKNKKINMVEALKGTE